MELTNWKTAYKKQSWGKETFGIEIRVAVDRPLNDNDSMAMDKIGDEIEAAIMGETMRLDPKEQESKKEEREKLLACFGDAAIRVKELPNGYCRQWCCTQHPWYAVTTKKGDITLGWRKRVISIEWEPSVAGVSESLFLGENSTKYDRLIHAWGYEKAQEYISILLKS